MGVEFCFIFIKLFCPYGNKRESPALRRLQRSGFQLIQPTGQPDRNNHMREAEYSSDKRTLSNIPKKIQRETECDKAI